jgi:hypothetical protein
MLYIKRMGWKKRKCWRFLRAGEREINNDGPFASRIGDHGHIRVCRRTVETQNRCSSVTKTKERGKRTHRHEGPARRPRRGPNEPQWFLRIFGTATVSDPTPVRAFARLTAAALVCARKQAMSDSVAHRMTSSCCLRPTSRGCLRDCPPAAPTARPGHHLHMSALHHPTR